MDIAFFIRRIIALIISLVMSFVPFFYNIMSNNEGWGSIFSYKEVFFSLSAIMVLCFCDIIEIIKELPTTLILICFSFWFFALLTGIFIYVKPNNESQTGNIIFTIVTIIIYILFNFLISKKRKSEET